MDEDRMLKLFDHGHLRGELASVSSIFALAARQLIENVERSPERTVALRKLLEAKDAAVRAKVHPGW